VRGIRRCKVETVAVQLPLQLARRVEAKKVPLGKAIVEAVERWLAERERPRVQPSADAEFLAALEQAGMRVKRSWDEWQGWFSEKPLSAAEVREMLAGVSPLSEVIIAERNERR
jgi:hypothetical protein